MRAIAAISTLCNIVNIMMIIFNLYTHVYCIYLLVYMSSYTFTQRFTQMLSLSSSRSTFISASPFDLGANNVHFMCLMPDVIVCVCVHWWLLLYTRVRDTHTHTLVCTEQCDMWCTYYIALLCNVLIYMCDVMLKLGYFCGE